MFKFVSPLYSLKKVNQIFSSFIFVISDYKKSLKSNFRAYAVYKMLKHLGVSIKTIQLNYIFVGKLHAEVNTYGGVFINETHRLSDTAPYIIAVDKNLQLIQDTNLMLQDYLLYAEPANIDITTDEIPTLKKLPLNSVALNTALEQFADLAETKGFIANLKSKLSMNGIVFGFSYLPLHQFKHSVKAVKYIEDKINRNEWYRKQYTLDELEDMFYEYFEDVEIMLYGSVFIFRLSDHYKKPDFSSIRLTEKNIEGKFIELNQDNENDNPNRKARIR